ncbi:hypothetical protein [Moritella viscosa]|uniref:hypothetical protein n=1 Tax=Moritella viscosa TaxID=80854 RepID=UPI0009129FE9|nr:hypothetical protein [Moritella viscosa]SGZ10150.1 UDP-glucuronosyl/UDP-glucosyltransferase [Moritella viscosa]
MTDAYCTAVIITPENLKKSVKLLFQRTNPETRLLKLNQLYQLIAKSCGFGSFQQLQKSPEIFLWISEITELIERVDKSENTNISSTEISDLFSCDIVCHENNGSIGVLVFNDNTVCKTPILTESKPYYSYGTLYELPVDSGVHLPSQDWRNFIHRVQQQINKENIEELIESEWSAFNFMDFDEIYLTDPTTAYHQDFTTLTEGEFRKLVCEQSVYSPVSAVYELLDMDRS